MVRTAGKVRIGAFEVNRLGFGTMRLTGPGVWGPPGDREEALAVLRRCVELGVELVDTADSYGPDVAEELIREALHPYPPSLRIATKAGFTRPGPGKWTVRGDPAYLRAQCEGSLRRLGVECIDLFQLHRIDPAVAAEDQFGLLATLREEGKVAEVGLSEVSVEELDAALAVVPVASVQNLYNIANRAAEDVLARCAALGVAFLPFFPLDSGRLSRPGGPLDATARSTGATVAQVCLAWLLRLSPVVAPIPGTSSVAHLEENCAAAEVHLDDAQFAELSGARRSLRRWALTNRAG